MSVIIYTALREIEETSFSASASDISVAAADDSFNSISTDLSGLSNDQWIQVGGFQNDDNNGWFQTSAGSTIAKIVQDTSAALVDEAAGLPVLIKGYTRGYGQSYSLEFDAQMLDVDRKFQRRRQIALGGGTPEVLLHRREKFWNIKTDYIAAADLPQWDEFFASVAAGEVFSFDAYGTVAAPDNPISCTLEEDGFKIARVGSGLLYEITASLRDVSTATVFPVAPTATMPFRNDYAPPPRRRRSPAYVFNRARVP